MGRVRMNLKRGLKWGLVLVLALVLAMSWREFRPRPIPTPGPTVTRTPGTRGIDGAGAEPPEAPTATETATATATAMPTDTPTPIPTDTPVITPTVTETPQPTSTPIPTSTTAPTVTLSAAAGVAPASAESGAVDPDFQALGVHGEIAPAVLANYFPWYDPGTWGTGCSSGGDQPRDGVYQSDDPAVIARHIGQAQAAGLDGFAVHWFAPGDRTDVNFGQVLGHSPDGFDSTVTFLYHILPGANQQGVIDGLSYIINSYGAHPRFYRAAGKPVILFSDMYRVPDTSGARPASDQDLATGMARWREIRQAVDPGHNTWWIAEGLQADYLAVFDGLYVYKIDHACCPSAYTSAFRWAGWVRDWEEQAGLPKLWVGTVMPGWDDVNSAQAHCADLRVSSAPFARDRAGGAYYAQTWEAVLPTQPDFVLLHSFNEWVEGSYIEPSARFGDLYVQLTAQWVAEYKGGW